MKCRAQCLFRSGWDQPKVCLGHPARHGRYGCQMMNDAVTIRWAKPTEKIEHSQPVRRKKKVSGHTCASVIRV
eukprot:scaffold34110_cov183-Amphora_coffeaeformis.AAC.2